MTKLKDTEIEFESVEKEALVYKENLDRHLGKNSSLNGKKAALQRR